MASEIPLLSIDIDSGVPVYRQIADSLRTLLVSGVLQPGQTLPPVRQLALDLGVHFNTVAEAYRILAEENWLDLKRRRGALVIERSLPPPPDPAKTVAFTRRVRDLIAEVQSSGIAPASIAHELRLLAKGLEK
jgi:GntR family transcriptional regulator